MSNFWRSMWTSVKIKSKILFYFTDFFAKIYSLLTHVHKNSTTEVTLKLWSYLQLSIMHHFVAYRGQEIFLIFFHPCFNVIQNRCLCSHFLQLPLTAPTSLCSSSKEICRKTGFQIWFEIDKYLFSYRFIIVLSPMYQN